MSFSYNKLWKLLIDKNMNKTELRQLTGLSPNTMVRLSKGESVKMDVVGRICEQLIAMLAILLTLCQRKSNYKIEFVGGERNG